MDLRLSFGTSSCSELAWIIIKPSSAPLTLRASPLSSFTDTVFSTPVSAFSWFLPLLLRFLFLDFLFSVSVVLSAAGFALTSKISAFFSPSADLSATCVLESDSFNTWVFVVISLSCPDLRPLPRLRLFLLPDVSFSDSPEVLLAV